MFNKDLTVLSLPNSYQKYKNYSKEVLVDGVVFGIKLFILIGVDCNLAVIAGVGDMLTGVATNAAADHAANKAAEQALSVGKKLIG